MCTVPTETIFYECGFIDGWQVGLLYLAHPKNMGDLSHIELSTISIKCPSENNLSLKKNKNDHFFLTFC